MSDLKTRIAEAIAKQLKYGFRGDELDIFTDDAVKAVLDIVEPMILDEAIEHDNAIATKLVDKVPAIKNIKEWMEDGSKPESVITQIIFSLRKIGYKVQEITPEKE